MPANYSWGSSMDPRGLELRKPNFVFGSENSIRPSSSLEGKEKAGIGQENLHHRLVNSFGIGYLSQCLAWELHAMAFHSCSLMVVKVELD